MYLACKSNNSTTLVNTYTDNLILSLTTFVLPD